MPDPYVSLADFKASLGISDTTDDDALTRALHASTEAVTDHCNRFFGQKGTEVGDGLPGPQTRTYFPGSALVLRTDDIVSVTSVTVDGVEWAEGDFILLPRNAPLDGRPYTEIRADNGKRFTDWVEVVGVFGWPAVPSVVEQATLLQASRLFKRAKDAPLGIAQIPQFDGVSGMRMLNKLDPDVEVLLSAVRRHPVMVG